MTFFQKPEAFFLNVIFIVTGLAGCSGSAGGAGNSTESSPQASTKSPEQSELKESEAEKSKDKDKEKKKTKVGKGSHEEGGSSPRAKERRFRHRRGKSDGHQPASSGIEEEFEKSSTEIPPFREKTQPKQPETPSPKAKPAESPKTPSPAGEKNFKKAFPAGAKRSWKTLDSFSKISRALANVLLEILSTEKTYRDQLSHLVAFRKHLAHTRGAVGGGLKKSLQELEDLLISLKAEAFWDLSSKFIQEIEREEGGLRKNLDNGEGFEGGSLTGAVESYCRAFTVFVDQIGDQYKTSLHAAHRINEVLLKTASLDDKDEFKRSLGYLLGASPMTNAAGLQMASMVIYQRFPRYNLLLTDVLKQSGRLDDNFDAKCVSDVRVRIDHLIKQSMTDLPRSTGL
ncbi:MAG: hypothetical protein HYX41_05735 [Bdellovibrio sp.]|nr:hypothetical protein [Bdellovibrio sp.]